MIKFPTATKYLLSSTVASDTSKLRFKADCGSMIKSLVLNLQERLRIKYIFVRSLVSLTPGCIIENKELEMIKFPKLTEKLYNNRQISLKESDQSRVQFKHFINDITFKNIDESVSYDCSKCQLGHFYWKYLDKNEKYNYLWKIIIKVFTMSHGQTHIERSFNVNREIVVENLCSKCLCAQRLVYDVINLSGKGVHEIDLPNKLVTSCITSYSRYNTALNESQSGKQAPEKSKKERFCKKKSPMLSERKWNSNLASPPLKKMHINAAAKVNNSMTLLNF